MKHKESFTLIEILVVIVIIGILSAFVLVGMSSVTESANITKSKAFSNSLRNSLLMNLVSEWKFDGPTMIDNNATNEDAKDSWGNNNTSSVGGNPLVKGGTNCLSGKCVAFDGSGDYFSVLDSSTLDSIFGTENFTLEAWIYSIKSAAYQGIINKRTSNYFSASPGGLFIDNNGDVLYFLIGTGNEAETIVSTSYNIINLHDKWIHVVGTAGNGYMKLYINSLQTTSPVAITLDPPTNDEPMTIGAFYAGSRSFSGRIDEVKIYNNPVSVIKIEQNYFLGLNNLYKNRGITLNEFNQRLTELKHNLANNE